MSPHERASPRFATALDRYEAAVAITRQNLRREHADADEADVEHRPVSWRLSRPAALHGDRAARPGQWPRQAR